MNFLSLSVILAPLLAIAAAQAETVYQCRDANGIAFTDEPSSPDCQPLDLKVIQPNPEDVARLEAKKRLDAEREQEQQLEQAQRRLLRAQEEAARAAARASEAERRLAEQQRTQPQAQPPAPLLYGWPVYPRYHLHPPSLPPTPPAAPPPIGIDRIGPRAP